MNSKRLDMLTEREREVWLLYEQGLTRKQIADQLCITAGTVAMHIRYAERRFRKSARPCLSANRTSKTLSFQLTTEEIKIIIKALCEYERYLVSDDASQTHRLSIEVQTITRLCERVKSAVFEE